MDANIDSREAGKILLENIELFEQSRNLLDEIEEEITENYLKDVFEYATNKRYIVDEDEFGITPNQWIIEDGKGEKAIIYMGWNQNPYDRDDKTTYITSTILGCNGVILHIWVSPSSNFIQRKKWVKGLNMLRAKNNEQVMQLEKQGFVIDSASHITLEYKIDKEALIRTYYDEGDYSKIFYPALDAFKKMEQAIPLFEAIFEQISSESN